MHRRQLEDAAPPQQAARSIEYAARALGIGRSSVYRLIREGRLQTFTLGRRRLVTDEAIRAVVENAAA
jgi:excisionase family DNA binding protein